MTQDASVGDYYKICAMYECEKCMGHPFDPDAVRLSHTTTLTSTTSTEPTTQIINETGMANVYFIRQL